jgi:hypothetical protein
MHYLGINNDMNFKWNPQKATLLISIPTLEISEKILSHATKNEYVIKPEFHISIVGLQNGQKILNQGFSLKVIEQIKTLAEEYSWEIKFLEEYYTIEKYYNEVELEKSGYKSVPPQIRRTIIQKTLLPDLEAFYKKLSEDLGMIFELPFPHVTLFAWADYEPMMTQGIGLYSEADFQKYKKEEIVIS